MKFELNFLKLALIKKKYNDLSISEPFSYKFFGTRFIFTYRKN